MNFPDLETKKAAKSEDAVIVGPRKRPVEEADQSRGGPIY